MRRGHAVLLSLIMLGTAANLAEGTLQGAVATGTWSDGATIGADRTLVSESCNLEYVCSITADADTHVGAAQTHGVCTDTTASVAGRNIAAPFCRAVFRITGLTTGGPQACDATTLGEDGKGDFTYTSADGLNTTVESVDITIANGVAKVQGELVAVGGRVIATVRASFQARCATSVHYGGWAGTFAAV